MADRFDPPLLVADEYGLRTICCAMDAIEFLEEWPFEQRCKLHQKASEVCCAAYDGRRTAESARTAFVAWARWVGICERNSPSTIEGEVSLPVVEHLTW